MKAKHLVTLCLLAGFLAGFGLWGLLRTPGDVSQAERRPLAQWPEFTVSGFLSGQYAGKLEHAAADQFPLREQFRTLRSLVSYDLLGQRDVDGVYLSGGYAAKLDFPLNTGSVDRAAQRFRYVYDTYLAGTEANVYLSVIPDKGYFLAPASGRPAMDYDALVSRLREGTPEMTYIDLFDRLTLEDYYRPDAHWRQERLGGVVDALGAAMGFSVDMDGSVSGRRHGGGRRRGLHGGDPGPPLLWGVFRVRGPAPGRGDPALSHQRHHRRLPGHQLRDRRGRPGVRPGKGPGQRPV